MYFKIYHDNVVTTQRRRPVSKYMIPGIIDTIVNEVLDCMTDWNKSKEIRKTLNDYRDLLLDEELDPAKVEEYQLMLFDILYHQHYDILITTGKLEGGDYYIKWEDESNEESDS